MLQLLLDHQSKYTGSLQLKGLICCRSRRHMAYADIDAVKIQPPPPPTSRSPLVDLSLPGTSQLDYVSKGRLRGKTTELKPTNSPPVGGTCSMRRRDTAEIDTHLFKVGSTLCLLLIHVEAGISDWIVSGVRTLSGVRQKRPCKSLRKSSSASIRED